MERKFLLFLCIYGVLFSHINCNIWDNIFSQTQASYPIMLSESFNINVTLPDNLDFDANIDFNSELKIITLKLSKNFLIQKVEFIKAQIDLSELILNVDQFLLGCEKFTLGLEDQSNGSLKKNIDGVNVSKKQLFLVNLLFKYIGKYSSKDSGATDGSHKKEDIEAGILDIFKGNKIFDSIADSGVFGDIKKDHPALNNGDQLNMFQFSVDFYKDPKNIIDQIKKAKNVAQKDLQFDEIGDFDLEDFNLDMIKFVILTEGKAGHIVKAFRNREMKEELQLSLKSKQTKKSECQKEAKKLTFQDLTNGAKYIYQSKDTIGNVFG